MAVIEKYKELNSLNKIVLWCAAISILVFGYTWATHTKYIGLDIKSEITNENNLVDTLFQPKHNSTTYLLSNKIARSSLIRSETNPETLTDPRTHVCLASSGSLVVLTGKTTTEGKVIYKEIYVISDGCKGKTGWVSSEFIIENHNKAATPNK